MNKQRKKGIFISLWLVLGVSIILAFFLFSMIVGGSAGNGYQENGKYFVGNHGVYEEVTETVYTISCILEVFFWIFIPLTPLGAFFISYIQEKIERRKNRFN